MTKECARTTELGVKGAKPTASVIIATYNRADMLSESLRSVLLQSYGDFEIIVADDGSTDSTRQVVAQLAVDCPRIRYFYQENSGRSAARNRGIDIAQGRYVASLDSDDIWLPLKLERQIAALEAKPEYAMAYSSAIVVDDVWSPLPYTNTARVSGSIYRHIAFYIPVTVLLPTVTIRTDVLRQVGPFDVHLDRFEDTDMWRRVSRHNRILAIQEPLCKVRTHSENQLAAQDPVLIVSQVTQYARKAIAEDSAGHIVFVRYGASRLYGHYGKALVQFPEWVTHGRGLLALSIKSWPFQPYLWCLWALASPSLSERKNGKSLRRLLLKGFALLLAPRRTAHLVAARIRGDSP